jgi:hypothetical protein
MDYKPLPANFGVLIAFVCVVCGMCFTVKGQPSEKVSRIVPCVRQSAFDFINHFEKL